VIYFADSFDHYGVTANIAKKWNGDAGATLQVAGRHGSGASISTISYIVSPGGTIAAAGRAMKLNVLTPTGQKISFQNAAGETLVMLQEYGDGRLVVHAGGLLSSPSSAVLNTKSWYFVELYASITLFDPGPPIKYLVTYTAKLNGDLTILFGSLGPIVYSNPVIARLNLLGGTVDDVWWTDGELLGDTHVRSYFANADGFYSDFTPSTPGAHYVLVNEANPSTATYLEATVIGQNESHDYPASDDDEIRGIQVCLYSNASVLSKLKPLLRSAGVDSLGGEQTAGGTYLLKTWRTSPFTAVDFTKAEVSAMEMGAQATG
jgi:hypothetical protein